VRVFANALGIAEDPVTGSASSFTAKYWAIKANVPPGEEFAVQQVSSRLGDLGVVWEEKTGSAKLRGETRVASRGEIYL
jgi:predicted PhzF superfamily epimerase YddE/YHI9